MLLGQGTHKVRHGQEGGHSTATQDCKVLQWPLLTRCPGPSALQREMENSPRERKAEGCDPLRSFRFFNISGLSTLEMLLLKLCSNTQKLQ